MHSYALMCAHLMQPLDHLEVAFARGNRETPLPLIASSLEIRTGLFEPDQNLELAVGARGEEGRRASIPLCDRLERCAMLMQ